jgi:arylsulfatase A-like enzyme
MNLPSDDVSGPNERPNEPHSAKPRSVVVVLLDSLNRHMLGAYGSSEFDTPNLDRVAERSVRFTNHQTGALPCMPARHDLLCGTLDFLWRPWGSVELWDTPITRLVREQGVTTMLVSDHPHLFETGGENYHCDFSAWEYLRGHEGDPWRTAEDPSWLGTPALPARPSARPHPYEISRTWFRSEEEFPGPKTMRAAANWLEHQAPHADRFLLVVDEFDPHEPFDVPEPWAGRYDPDWEGPSVIWPPYSTAAVASGAIDARTARHIRANYGAKLTFIDHWLGRILDRFDEQDLWSNTALIVCTDHGHYLGERDFFGKPGAPIYRPLGHIPLLVAWPGRPADTIDALTTTVDIFSTLCDVFDASPPAGVHGSSLNPLLDGTASAIREWAITGYWGREITITDGTVRYTRSPVAANRPLSMWSNRWSTMPIHSLPNLRLPMPDVRAVLDTMPYSDIPVIRQPFDVDDPVPFWAYRAPDGVSNELFDISVDPDENENLASGALEDEMVDLLRSALTALEAPEDQLVRLALV